MPLPGISSYRKETIDVLSLFSFVFFVRFRKSAIKFDMMAEGGGRVDIHFWAGMQKNAISAKQPNPIDTRAGLLFLNPGK